MRLTECIRPEPVLADVETGTLEELITSFAGMICQATPSLECDALFTKLLQREKEMSTGMENRVAIPHAIVEGIDEPVCLVARLAEPLSIETLDGQPIRIMFVLVSPPQSISVHIRTLARIARLCSAEGFVDRMLQADAHDLFETIREEDSRHV